MSKPTIVLIPGCWLPASIYAGTVQALERHGYPASAMQLPSCNADPPAQDFSTDVEGIRKRLVGLIEDEQKDVVLAVHSYTGLPASEAAKGLGKKQREAEGQRGGLLRIVSIAAYAMPEGFQATAGDVQFPGWMKPDLEVSLLSVSCSPSPLSSFFLAFLLLLVLPFLF